MNKFDKYIKKKLSDEPIEIPNSAKNNIEHMLQSLPEYKSNKKHLFYYPRLALLAGCCAFITLFIFPNISLTYAKAIDNIPLIGDIVRVFTIRNYYYRDEYHEMDIKVPQIESSNNYIFAPINSEIQQLTDVLLDQFNNDLELIGDEGHSSIHCDYSVVTNTDTWFTLRIQILQIAGSGNTTYEYYHLNKLTSKVVELKDIVADQKFYDILNQAIENQMINKMKEDENLIYWVDDNVFGNCVNIDPLHNFYWDADGNIVIPFDKYEVAPGYMGTSEFTVNKELFAQYIKDEYKNLFSSSSDDK